MALRGGFSKTTPLQLALDRGSRPGATLGDQLDQLGEYTIKSNSDAESICRLLAQCVGEDAQWRGASSLHALIGLFQEVESRDSPAFDVMCDLGLPLLMEIVDTGCEPESAIDPDDVFFALKILVIYGTCEGTDAVIRIAQRRFQPDSYWWHLILNPYGDGHPESERLFRALSDPLPVDFLALSLIDSANAACKGNADLEHPFDNSAGKQQIERWLTDHDQGHCFYAVNATAALLHISNPERDSLLAMALDHSSGDVRVEAALVCARLGRHAGIEELARFCLNVHHSLKARDYLAALEREDAIPAESLDPAFRARGELSRWLADPNELGRPPDDLEILDQRELAWPPEYERKTLWLIKYRLHGDIGSTGDEQGLGIVGSITFRLTDDTLEQRSPEDAFAIHCYWELEAKGFITEADVEDGSTEYDGMLRQFSFHTTRQPRITRVVEIAPELRYPQRLIGLAIAIRNDEPGWIVLDGPRSQWCRASVMPSDHDARLIVMLHVGRVLLGFRG